MKHNMIKLFTITILSLFFVGTSFSITFMQAHDGDISVRVQKTSKFSVEAGGAYGIQSGNHETSIGGNVNTKASGKDYIQGDISTLKYPVNTTTGTAWLKLEYSRLSVKVSLEKSLGLTGNFEDIDFIHTSGYRYSYLGVSDQKATAEIDGSFQALSADMLYEVLDQEGLKLAFGLGFLTMSGNFEASNAYVNSPLREDRSYSGRVITNDYDIAIPYLMLATQLQAGEKWSIELNLKVGAFGSFSDENVHLLRAGGSRKAETKSSNARMFEGSGAVSYAVTDNVSAYVEAYFRGIGAEGNSRVKEYGRLIHTIDDDLKRSELGVKFGAKVKIGRGDYVPEIRGVR